MIVEGEHEPFADVKTQAPREVDRKIAELLIPYIVAVSYTHLWQSRLMKNVISRKLSGLMILGFI